MRRVCAAVPIVALLCTACGTTAPAAAPAANVVSGGSTCPAPETQDLTFSGHFTGHLKCSTSPADCVKAATARGVAPGLTVPINGSVSGAPAQFLIVFYKAQPGTYSAGKLGDDPATSTQQGVTFDGGGHWETPTPGGSMALLTNDATGASGTIDVSLGSGTDAFAVKGSWRCIKPAGY